jgi:hypothetical protein
MIDSIFTQLNRKNTTAFSCPEPQKVLEPQVLEAAEIDVEDLRSVLTRVFSDLDITQQSLQKLYEEANYIYSRLDHMETSISAKKTSEDLNNDKKENDEGSSGSGQQGDGGAVVEKLFDTGVGDGGTDDKLVKLREAKKLTQGLLSTIEKLSLKVQESNANNAAHKFGIK